MTMLFQVRLTPTEDELVDGLKRSGVRRASTLRLVAQTIALALVAGWSLVAFVTDAAHDRMSLCIAIVAAVLIPVMWFVPVWQMKSMAKDTVESGTSAKMWVFEDGIDFGEEQPDKAYYPYDSFYCHQPDPDHPFQTMVFRFASDEVIVVPKSLLTEEQWQYLLQKTADSTEQPRRHGR